MNEPLFFEEQKFRQKRVLILTAIPPALLTLLAIWQVGLGHQWGRQPMPNGALVIWSGLLWLLYLHLINIRLITQLFPGELRVAMKGLWRSARIPLSKVRSARAVTFDAAADWGGYGMRRSRRGTAYMARGNRGVELEMADGLVVVIGSDRAADLAERIERERRS